MKYLKKVVLTLVMVFAIILPSIVFAETVEVKTEKELAEVFKNGGTAKLTENLTLSGDINLDDGKTLTLDLNEHNISTEIHRIKVNKGYLTITGKGTIDGKMDGGSPVVLYGSDYETDVDYSSLTIDENVTLKGHYGFVFSYYAYGAKADLKGTFMAIGKEIGLDDQPAFAFNGFNHSTKNYPTINIYSTAKFISDDYGIYAAGYANWNIDGATIEGKKAGIGIKSGKFNIKNAKISTDGKFVEGTYNGNGINSNGAAIAIESNNTYAGNIDITIDGGTYTSLYGPVIYHYLAPKDETDVVESKLVKSVEIKDGTFNGTLNMMKSDELSVSGGSFTDKTVSESLVKGYKMVQDGSMYTIVSEDKGEIIEVPSEVDVSEDVDKDIAKEITDAKITNPVTGLKDAIDASKIEGILNTLIKVSLKSKVTSYDKDKNILIYDIKPYYDDGTQELKLIPNEAINGKVKVKVAIPASILFTHAKVLHKDGDKLLDTKEYEIKELNGQKYIEIETDSFSTFELSFFTPTSVENPNTIDGILLYTAITLLSFSLLGATALILKKKMN